MSLQTSLQVNVYFSVSNSHLCSFLLSLYYIYLLFYFPQLLPYSGKGGDSFWEYIFQMFCCVVGGARRGDWIGAEKKYNLGQQKWRRGLADDIEGERVSDSLLRVGFAHLAAMVIVISVLVVNLCAVGLFT